MKRAQKADLKENSDYIEEIVELVNLLKSVDTHSPEAKLNATTISDGKGGRILL